MQQPADPEGSPADHCDPTDAPVCGAGGTGLGIGIGWDRPTPWRWVVCPVLVLLVLATFLPGLSAGFVYWDDDQLVIDHAQRLTFEVENLRWMWTTSFSGHFQPATWLSYALDRSFWSDETFGFHFTNVALHALSVVAFYFIARQLLAVGLRGSPDRRCLAVVLAATLAAVLFGIHPLRVESVVWIAERRDVLAGFFFLLSVACYLRYASVTPGAFAQSASSSMSAAVSPAPSRAAATLWYAGTVLFCLVSLLAKASAVVMPALLLVLDVYPLRRATVAEPDRWRRRLWLLVEKTPLIVLAGFAAVLAIAAQAKAGAMHTLSEYGLGLRAAQACYGLSFYIFKTLLPTHLGPLYQLPTPGVLLGAMLWISLLGLAALAAVTVALRRRCPALWAALAAYVVIVAPVLGLVQSGQQLVADRYSYLSCLGFAVLGGAALCVAIRRWGLLRGGTPRAITALALTLLVVLMHVATWRQAEYWDTAGSLWARAVVISPTSSIVHVKYGDALAHTALAARPGMRNVPFEQAIEHYRIALELDPTDAIASSHLAIVLAKAGQHQEAIDAYYYAIELDPWREHDRIELANLLTALRRPNEGIALLRAGAMYDPASVKLPNRLADLLATHGDPTVRNGAEAIGWARQAIANSHGDDPRAMMTLATAYAEFGHLNLAAATARDALRRADNESKWVLANELKRRLSLFEKGQPFHRNMVGR